MSRDHETLAAPAWHEAVIRKSRFRADAAPVTDPEAAMAWITTINVPATHHCWAWRVGDSYRSSDDGEPGGSAGRPILAAIDGQGLDGVAVVVTRWFGGIKLGVGGLVRAYGGTAAECLRTAPRHRVRALATLQVDCDASLLALLAARLPAFDACIAGQTFAGAAARLTVHVPQARVEDVTTLLREMSRGRAEVRFVD